MPPSFTAGQHFNQKLKKLCYNKILLFPYKCYLVSLGSPPVLEGDVNPIHIVFINYLLHIRDDPHAHRVHREAEQLCIMLEVILHRGDVSSTAVHVV